MPVTSAAPAGPGRAAGRSARAAGRRARAAGRSSSSTARAVATTTARLSGLTTADVAGQVDDAEHPAGVGIHDRRSRARPALDGLGEVLGREDLHGMGGGHRRADRVRARAGLAPQRALDEVHVVGRAVAQLRVALDAQQQAVGVADDEEMVGVEQGLGHALVDERAGGRSGWSSHGSRVPWELDDRRRGLAPARVDAGVARALPGVGDRAADSGRAGILVVGPARPSTKSSHASRSSGPVSPGPCGVDGTQG